MIQGRGDEDAVVTVLPQADHGDLDVLIDQGQVGQALGADADGTAGDAGLGNLVHGARIAHGLSRVGLGRGDESPAQPGENRIQCGHGVFLR